MIGRFRHKGLEGLFYDGKKKGVQPQHAKKLNDILDLLDAAVQPEDMGFPGSGLHPLKGDKYGFWSVKVSGDWRITFRFEEGHATDVDYKDYH